MRLDLFVFRLAFATTALHALQAQTPRPGRVRGVVLDSLLRAPLAGATVFIPGMARSTTTDSTGRFLIDDVPPGEQTVAFHHPTIDSLGLDDSGVKVRIFPGATSSAELATPSLATLQRAFCTDSSTGRAPTLAYGHVRSMVQGQPVTVNIVWREPADVRYGSATMKAVNFSDGQRWAACGLPIGAWVSASTTDSATSAIAIFALGPRGVAMYDLQLRSGLRRLHGRVLDQARRPIAGARVTVAGSAVHAISAPDGTFMIDDAPNSTLTLDARQTGYVPRLRVISPDDDGIALTLLPLPATGFARQVGSDLLRFELRNGSGGELATDPAEVAALLTRVLREAPADAAWFVDGVPVDEAFARAHRAAALKSIEFHRHASTTPIEFRSGSRAVILLWTAAADW